MTLMFRCSQALKLWELPKDQTKDQIKVESVLSVKPGGNTSSSQQELPSRNMRIL